MNALIHHYLGHTATANQSDLIQGLTDFINHPQRHFIYLLKGFAGTGKTSVVAALIKSMYHLQLPCVLMAPTGRAAKVLSNYAQKPASTIHKKIYRQKSLTDDLAQFTIDRNTHRNTLFIVDEASMISTNSYDRSSFGSGNLLSDLVKYVKSGTSCRLLFIGDNAQLPPVGFDFSPALDLAVLNQYGDCVASELTEVVRQQNSSGILHNANKIRAQLDDQNYKIPLLEVSQFADIEAISGNELIECLSDAFRKYGEDETIIICRSNKRAFKYNQGVRGAILFCEDEISTNDRLMIVKNNYQPLDDNEAMDFIANGDMARIKRIKKYQNRYGLRYVDVVLKFEDYADVEISTKLIVDTLSLDYASLPAEKNKELFNLLADDYQHISDRRLRFAAIKADPYFNALQVKFAYAITCHKAQGGQWKCVFLDQAFFGDYEMKKEDIRWLYTAFTRASMKLYLINFDKELIS